MTAAAPPAHPQLAVSASIFRDGKILLVRRARLPAKGIYSLPGGRVEFGEALQDALAREVDEETGLAIDIIGLSGWREVLPAQAGGSGGGGHYVIMSFSARWRAGEIRLNDELDDFQWRTPDRLDGLTLTDGLPDIIAAARRLLG
jgi:8-oxo-dGTP diphosphatase